MMNDKVSEYLDKAPVGQKEIMNKVRSIIHATIPDVIEEYKWNRPIFRKNKDFAYFQATKNHLSLGFINIQKINDPSGKLEGTGKDMRHIKLKSVDDIDEAELKNWFKAIVSE